MDEMLERLARRLPDAPQTEETRALLRDLLEDAQAWALAYTRRKALPEELSSIVLRLAAMLYNRMGIEGEATHAEGGITLSIDAVPLDIREALNAYRLARTAH